jgi:hypothetical protein
VRKSAGHTSLPSSPPSYDYKLRPSRACKGSPPTFIPGGGGGGGRHRRLSPSPKGNLFGEKPRDDHNEVRAHSQLLRFDGWEQVSKGGEVVKIKKARKGFRCWLACLRHFL